MVIGRARLSYSGFLLLAMLVAISLVGAAMFYDETREFEAALAALQDEQVALATALAADLEGRLRRVDEPLLTSSPDELARAVPRLLRGAIELQQAGSRVLLVSPPGHAYFMNAQGQRVTSPTLAELLEAGRGKVLLARERGPELGLPERLVAGGLRRVAGPSGRPWGVSVLASAERLRARERHAQLRFLLGLVLVTIAVGGMGGLALRDQRRKLATVREREVAELQRERERLLAKADKMATLAALSSGVAHQIATPLSTITARVEQVLPALVQDAKASSALAVVNEQVQRIQHTIRGLLDLARSNQPSLARTAPETVARGAVRAVLHRFERSGVQVALELADRLPPISCDAPILEQALVNLLLNALDASEGTERVTLAVATDESNVTMIVEDTGHGITDEAVKRAGEPFYTTKPRQRGTGLGLAIAQEIVANHGGKLALARRQDGPGTRATITLPRA